MAELRELLAARGRRRRRRRRSSAATARRARLYNFDVDHAGGVLMAAIEPRCAPGLRESATFDRDVDRGDPARGARRASTTSAAGAPSVGCRTSTISPSSPCTLAGAARGLPRALRDAHCVLGTRFATERPVELAIPITVCGHELRRALAQRQGRRWGSARPGRAPRPPRAMAACTRWSGSTPSTLSTRSARRTTGTTRATWPARRRGRDRRRPGRQAWHRRRPARRQGLRRGGPHAPPPARRRPALARAPSRLHRSLPTCA